MTIAIEEPPVRVLNRLMSGDQTSRLISAMVVLGVPDQLRCTPKTAEQLAEDVGAHGPTLRRILRFLAAAGVFDEVAGGRFALNELSELLRRDVDGSAAPFALMKAEATISVRDVLHTATTGQPAFEHAHKASYYEYVAGHPELEALWNAAMSSRATRLSQSLGDLIDWTDVSTVVDVGGNEGALLAGILANHPQLAGILFDQPHVVAGSPQVFNAAGVAERVEAVGGDFFLSVPTGGDVYFVANVLWNWPDEQAATILRNCHVAMADARLVVCETVVPDTPGPHPAKNLDITNLMMFGGKARTLDEWSALLAATGFTITRVAGAALDWTVIEARPTDVAT